MTSNHQSGNKKDVQRAAGMPSGGFRPEFDAEPTTAAQRTYMELSIERMDQVLADEAGTRSLAATRPAAAA